MWLRFHRALFLVSGIFIYELNTSFSLAQLYKTDSLLYFTPARISLGFERNVNTYQWDMYGGYSFRGEGWNLSLTDRYQSSLIRTNKKFIKDENAFTLSGRKNIILNLDIIAKVNSIIFSDQKSLALNSLASNTFEGGVHWNPFDEIKIQPLIGYKFDDQLGIKDKGVVYTGSLFLQPLAFGKYTASGDLYYRDEHLTPRLLEERHLNLLLHANFSNEAQNRTTFEYRKLRRDYYLPFPDLAQTAVIHHSIESRTEELTSAGDELTYRISSPLAFTLSFDASQRLIFKNQEFLDVTSALPVFNSRIRESHLNGNMALSYHDEGGTRAEFKMSVNERDENYSIDQPSGIDPLIFLRQQKIEELKNNGINQTSISFTGLHAFSSTDTIFISASSIKLMYDTPSESNYDDRDELFFLFNSGWSHRFSNKFVARLSTEVNLRHTVYIYAQRSANNLWNRVLRLSPVTEYSIPNTLNMKTFAEVIANYSVYDFEDVKQTVQSFSLRQMTIGDSTSVRLYKNIWVTSILQMRVYERGEMYWSSFTIRPLNYFDEKTAFLFVTLEKEIFKISSGFRFFQQVRYGYNNLEKKFENQLTSFGPTCRVEFFFPSGAKLFIDGWYQLTQESHMEAQKVPNLMMGVLWNL